MKLIGVRFLGITLLFSRSFLYVLILINLFINVKKFANFLDNFLTDYFISENTTYREAKIACEKLFKQASHEIELRALESETKK